MTYYERIKYIANECLKNEIPFEMSPIFDGWQIKFNWANGADAAAHFGTYGSDSDKVETYQFPWDKGDVSVFSPEMAFLNIKNLWNKRKS